MIRVNSFFGKSFRAVFAVFSDLQLLENSYASTMKTRMKCPRCGQKGDFSDASPYSRSLITVENGKRKEHWISVSRLRCSCGHCPAVIPDFLIPYGSYTIRFILHVLKAYLHRTSSVASLCEQWQISVSTLYDWIHRFRDHFNLWNGIIRSIHWVSDTSIDQVSDLPGFVSEFLSLTVVFSFLQHYPTSPHPSG